MNSTSLKTKLEYYEQLYDSTEAQLEENGYNADGVKTALAAYFKSELLKELIRESSKEDLCSSGSLMKQERLLL